MTAHKLQSAGINTSAHMGMAWHEIYTISSKFSRSSKSSLYAAMIMVLSQAQTLLSWQNNSRIPCPSQRKHTVPWMVCTVALGAISKNSKRKGLGTYRSARLTSDLGNITQTVFLGCKRVKKKNFTVLISKLQIYQGQMMFSKPGCLLQQSDVMFVDVMYLSIRKAFNSIFCQMAAEELWTGRNDV